MLSTLLVEGPPEEQGPSISHFLPRPCFPSPPCCSAERGAISAIILMVSNQTCACDCVPSPCDTFQQVNTDNRSAALEGFVKAQRGLGFLNSHLPSEAARELGQKPQTRRATPRVSWRTETAHTHVHTHTDPVLKCASTINFYNRSHSLPNSSQREGTET